MSKTDQQYCRDLRERLNSRRQRNRPENTSDHDLRSRSRSTNDKDGSDDRRSARPSHRGDQRRPVRDESCSSWPRRPGSSDSSRARSSFVVEEDPGILARRQKQLDYGKNTLCYQEYIKAVPKHKRQPFHPRTPIKMRQTSRRRWDSAIKNWRIHLHYWNDHAKLSELRSRKRSDSEASDPVTADPPAAEQATVNPEPTEVKTEPEPTLADTSAAVKVEPGLTPDLSLVKQEPAAVKAEPTSTPDLSLVKREPAPLPDLGAVKQELPEAAGHATHSAADSTWRSGRVKREPGSDSEDDGREAAFNWADDVEGLAEEFSGDPTS